MHKFWTVIVCSFWRTINFFEFWNKKLKKLSFSEARFRPSALLFTVSRNSGNSKLSNQNKNISHFCCFWFWTKIFDLLCHKCKSDLLKPSEDIFEAGDSKNNGHNSSSSPPIAASPKILTWRRFDEVNCWLLHVEILQSSSTRYSYGPYRSL